MDSSEWFTRASLMSVGGASLAVTLVSNTLRTAAHIKKRNMPMVVLLLSLAIVAGTAALQPPSGRMVWLLVPFNACLLFCTALGINGVGAVATSKGKGVAAGAGFFDSWLS